MLNVLHFSKNKLYRRYFDNNLQEFSRTNIPENVTGHSLIFDCCFNGRLMLKQLNDLNFKWNELSKVVKTDRESSPAFCYLHGAHLFP